MTNRTLRRNGSMGKKDGDDGSHESAGLKTPQRCNFLLIDWIDPIDYIACIDYAFPTESQSDTELAASEGQDVSSPLGSASTTDQRPSEDQEEEPNSPSPTKSSPGQPEPRTTQNSGTVLSLIVCQ